MTLKDSQMKLKDMEIISVKQMLDDGGRIYRNMEVGLLFLSLSLSLFRCIAAAEILVVVRYAIRMLPV
jgi:hypothetical protein